MKYYFNPVISYLIVSTILLMKDTSAQIFYSLGFIREGFLVGFFLVVGFCFFFFDNLNCRVHFLSFFSYQQASKNFCFVGSGPWTPRTWKLKDVNLGFPSVDSTQLFTFTFEVVQECSRTKSIAVITLQLSSSQLDKIAVICQTKIFCIIPFCYREK